MNVREKVKKNKKSGAVLASGLISLSVLGLHGLRDTIASTSTMPISVRLIKAIELTLSTSLSFGTLAMTAERGGYARLDPSLNRLIIDDNSSLAMAGGTPTVGRFTLKGASFPITVSVESTAVQLTNGIETVTVSQFNLLTAEAGGKVTITPDVGQNTITIPLGASLITRPGQSEGTYVGSTRIFANFQ